MNRRVFGFILIGVVLVSTGGCLVVMLAPSSEKQAVVREGYCPECGKELTRGGTCPTCFVQKTKEKAKAAGPSFWRDLSPKAKWAIFSGATLLNVLLIYCAWMPRFKRKRDEYAPHRFRCPKCRRKFKYADSKIGVSAVCTGCHESFVFPEPSEEEATA